MTDTILPRSQGATYFFTVCLADPHADTLVRHVDLLRQAVRVTRNRYPFEIRTAVVLPATLHMMWTLPPGDVDYPRRWRLLKSTFSRHVPVADLPPVTDAMQRRREKGVWRRGYWSHEIRDQLDYELHHHLIIHAPVAAALAKTPRDWALSSVHIKAPGKPLVQPQLPMGVQPRRAPDATLF